MSAPHSFSRICAYFAPTCFPPRVFSHTYPPPRGLPPRPVGLWQEDHANVRPKPVSGREREGYRWMVSVPFWKALKRGFPDEPCGVPVPPKSVDQQSDQSDMDFRLCPRICVAVVGPPAAGPVSQATRGRRMVQWCMHNGQSSIYHFLPALRKAICLYLLRWPQLLPVNPLPLPLASPPPV